jgi:hypothetical protein
MSRVEDTPGARIPELFHRIQENPKVIAIGRSEQPPDILEGNYPAIDTHGQSA